MYQSNLREMLGPTIYENNRDKVSVLLTLYFPEGLSGSHVWMSRRSVTSLRLWSSTWKREK